MARNVDGDAACLRRGSLLYSTQNKSQAAAAAIVKRLTANTKKLPAMKNKAFTEEYGSGLLDLAAALGAP